MSDFQRHPDRCVPDRCTRADIEGAGGHTAQHCLPAEGLLFRPLADLRVVVRERRLQGAVETAERIARVSASRPVPIPVILVSNRHDMEAGFEPAPESLRCSPAVWGSAKSVVGRHHNPEVG